MTADSDKRELRGLADLGARASALAAVVLCAGTATAQDYDLVILNGRVMDPETTYDAVANVGVRDGRIVAITREPITGRETIDASGHVVAPGFIDTHFHWQRPLGYRLGLLDGVTSSMDLEMGTAGNRVAEWYESREGKTQVNYGCGSSHEMARSFVLDQPSPPPYDTIDSLRTRKLPGWASAKPDLEQGNAILAIIDQGLQQGAIGIAGTTGYMREGVTPREMFEVQRVGARWGRQTSVHLRGTPGTEVTEPVSAQEILGNALALDAPACINHFNNPGWPLIHELLYRLQDQGHNVWGEIYPYAAGSTTLNAVFLKPETWVQAMGHRYEDTLQDPTTGKFFTQEDYDRVMKEDPTREMILYKMPKEDTIEWLRLKGVTMASDAMAADPIEGPWDFPLEKVGNTHPRTAGARGATLRLARENDIPLMHILSILSYNAAKHLGDTGLEAMQERGRMQTGMVADIVVFDPENVRDNSTYQQGALPTTGIPYVVVNGVVVVKDSAVQPVFPGQPIRHEPAAKPRFEPLDPATWKRKYYAADGVDTDCCVSHPSSETH